MFAQNNKITDEFLFAVVELHRSESSTQFDVEFKLTKVVSEKLRIPTRSEYIPPISESSLSIQIKDDSDQVLDEITLNDPFLVNREYVNDEGQLAHVSTNENDRSILIRRPISSKATQLQIVSKSNKRSSVTFTKKFR